MDFSRSSQNGRWTIDLQVVFRSPANGGAVSQVIGFLRETKRRIPPVTVLGDEDRSEREEFYLFMPTEAAFECEMRLCRAIVQYGQRAISEGSLRMHLNDFVETHTFVYSAEKRDVKRGDLAEWYKGTLLLIRAAGDAFVCNPIQLWLYHLLEPKVSGRYSFLTEKNKAKGTSF